MRYKIFSLYLLIIIIPFITKSQIIDEYGIKIGYVHSKISPKVDAFNTSYRSGFNVGIFAEKKICKFVKSKIGFEYSGKGYRLKSVETDETGNVIKNVWANTRLDYLSIPLLFKIVKEDIKYKPFIQLGPRLDYIFNFKKGTYNYTKHKVKDDLPEHINIYSVNLGYDFSIGFYLPIFNQEEIIIEARYSRDFSKVPSDYNTFFGENISYYFCVGYTF